MPGQLDCGTVGSMVGMDFNKGGKAEVILSVAELLDVLSSALPNDREVLALREKHVTNTKGIRLTPVIARKRVAFQPIVSEE